MRICKQYALNQCALYKVGSKARLAAILEITLEKLLALSSSDSNYRVFLLPKETCEFTQKVTNERWAQEPKAELRRIHERIQKLLSRVDPPNYAHAAIKRRSYRSNALAHLGAKCVANFDIRKFYPSTSNSHVYNFFREQLECAPDVAALLTDLVCYKGKTPAESGGLPTGSPLSPIMSLFANMPLFDKLSSLATSHNLTFTCYMDDLTFSGATLPVGLPKLVKSVVVQFGYKLSDNKTRIYRGSAAKHITGVVLKGSNICVPNSRFQKMRAIQGAIALETSSERKLLLTRKLAGLLGEASHLDSRYKSWAKNSYDDLKEIQEVVDTIVL